MILPSHKNTIIGPGYKTKPRRRELELTPEQEKMRDKAKMGSIWHHQYDRVYKNNGVFKIGPALAASDRKISRGLKISFDFDSCLSTKKIQLLLSVMDASKAEFFIVTSRETTNENVKNEDVMKIAEAFDIQEKNIIYTEGAYKAGWLNKLGIDIHFDDMPDEIAMINNQCPNTLGMLVTVNMFGDAHYLLNNMDPKPSIQQFEQEFE